MKTHFPSQGNPFIDSFYASSKPVGNALYVDSVNGSATGPGFSPESAFSTLAAAITAAKSNNGDVIYISPAHAETIIGAAGVLVNKNGLTIIGLGYGNMRPQFTFTTAVAASFDISGSSVNLQNIAFVNGIDNQTAMNNVTGSDVGFDNCFWTTNTATTGAAIGILTAATATRFRVENCNFFGPAVNSGTTTTAQIDHEVGVDYIIRKNLFCGKMTQAITNATTILRGFIDDNRFVIGTGTKAINMATASTPFITNNKINVASGTAPVIAAAGFVAGNVYSAAAGVTAGAAITW